MSKLDSDTLALYKLLAKHGSEWVKKRLCPKDAAQHAINRHFNVQAVTLDATGGVGNWIQPLKLNPDLVGDCALNTLDPSQPETLINEDDGEPQ